MFPLILNAGRATAIRWADLGLRLLTLDAVQLPDSWFAAAVPTQNTSASMKDRAEKRRRQRNARQRRTGQPRTAQHSARPTNDAWDWPSCRASPSCPAATGDRAAHRRNETAQSGQRR